MVPDETILEIGGDITVRLIGPDFNVARLAGLEIENFHDAPTLPDPEALDQMMLLSVGSGVAQPLSPPATLIQALRGIMPPPPVRLGPR
jgi:hypothetical protein